MRIFSASIERILSKSNPNANIISSTEIKVSDSPTLIDENENEQQSLEKVFSNPIYDYSHLEEYEQYQTRRELHSLDMSDW